MQLGKLKLTIDFTWEIKGPICDLRRNSLLSPFSTTDGNASKRKVCPVGAVSKTTTEKFIPCTNLINETIVECLIPHRKP